MNNYDFWEEYLKRIKEKMKILCRSKKELYIDLHIHSNYSADGKQSIGQILESTRNLGFDIIAITDHDTLNAYDELYEYVKVGLTNPIVIPGIEFTVDNKDYGNQCHLLQLFVNPKDNIICKNVETNYLAMFNRSKIQFKRLKENLAISEILKNKKMNISFLEYKRYLVENEMIPEYDTLCFYLIDKFQKKNVTTFDILKKLEKYNALDCYIDRKEFKTRRYKKLREKYENTAKNFYNSRFLLSMLAVREVDDDWWDSPSSGSLSVNSFGQIGIEDLNEKYDIYFAHPEEKKLEIVKNILKTKNNIVGLEVNYRSEYENINNLYKVIKNNKLTRIIGSDSHDNTLQFYNNMDFYKIESLEILKLIK